MTIVQFLFLLAFHWFADFVLQSDWMAINKSKNNWALLLHVSIYTIIFAAVTPIVFLDITDDQYIKFLGVNAILHLVTDYITSRINSYLYTKDRHNFFVMVGFDQLIHQITLAVTALWLIG